MVFMEFFLSLFYQCAEPDKLGGGGNGVNILKNERSIGVWYIPIEISFFPYYGPAACG